MTASRPALACPPAAVPPTQRRADRLLAAVIVAILAHSCSDGGHVGIPAAPDSPTGPGVPVVEVTFSDPRLTLAVRRSLPDPSMALTAEAVAGLAELVASEQGISDLGGIQQLAGLRVLDLSFNRIASVALLARLPHVQRLNLAGNEVRDLRPLSYVVGLRSLILDQNPVQDVSPLVTLDSLQSLELALVPLSARARQETIPLLEARGVAVRYQAAVYDALPDSLEIGGWADLQAQAAYCLFFTSAGYLYAGPRRVSRLGLPELMVSDDGGVFWAPLVRQLPAVRVTYLDRIYVDPVRPEMVVAHAGLTFLRSGDGGFTWERLDLGSLALPTNQPVVLPQVVPDPRVDGTLYILSPHGQRLYVSRDYGQTAELVHTPTRAFALAADGSLLRTSGNTTFRQRRGEDAWVQLPTVGSGHTVVTFAAPPAPDERLYAVLLLGLYVSHDLGQTWQLLLQAPSGEVWTQACLRFDPRDTDRLFLLVDGALYTSADGGVSFQSRQPDLPRGVLINDLAVEPNPPGSLYLATDTGILKLDSSR